LSGIWKFYHSSSPFEAPNGFTASGFDMSDWHDIQVPGMWQLQNYGRPQYINVMFPFPCDPPNAPFEHNQTGCYVRLFTLPLELRGENLRLRFEGVDSAFHVFLNGHEIGYSQGSRNHSEFDITSLVNNNGENILGVRVYQYCDGSYIEDQDQWRMSGIFRDVFLVAFPRVAIEDFHIKAALDEFYKDGVLSIKVKTTGAGTLKVDLLDDNKSHIKSVTEDIDSGSTIEIPVKGPQKWTAETPYLYHLVMHFGHQVIAHRIGKLCSLSH